MEELRAALLAQRAGADAALGRLEACVTDMLVGSSEMDKTDMESAQAKEGGGGGVGGGGEIVTIAKEVHTQLTAWAETWRRAAGEEPEEEEAVPLPLFGDALEGATAAATTPLAAAGSTLPDGFFEAGMVGANKGRPPSVGGRSSGGGGGVFGAAVSPSAATLSAAASLSMLADDAAAPPPAAGAAYGLFRDDDDEDDDDALFGGTPAAPQQQQQQQQQQQVGLALPGGVRLLTWTYRLSSTNRVLTAK
jgi:hypothetical protein